MSVRSAGLLAVTSVSWHESNDRAGVGGLAAADAGQLADSMPTLSRIRTDLTGTQAN